MLKPPIGIAVLRAELAKSAGPELMSEFSRVSVVTAMLVTAPAISTFARSGHAASSSGDFSKFIGLGFALVIALVVAAMNASKKPKRLSKEQADQLQAEAMEFFNRLEAGTFKPPETPVVLGTDETALLHESSNLLEGRATRVYAGGGTRVGGIYVGGGQSTSIQSLKELDSGMLTLTTNRLIFTGSIESRIVNAKDIVSVEAMADAIEISTAKRTKRQVYLVRNPVLWGALLRTMSRGEISFSKKTPAISTIGESPQLPPESSQTTTDIHFNCPHCAQHLAVEKKGAGMTVNCPTCNESITIPIGSSS